MPAKLTAFVLAAFACLLAGCSGCSQMTILPAPDPKAIRQEATKNWVGAVVRDAEIDDAAQTAQGFAMTSLDSLRERRGTALSIGIVLIPPTVGPNAPVLMGGLQDRRRFPIGPMAALPLAVYGFEVTDEAVSAQDLRSTAEEALRHPSQQSMERLHRFATATTAGSPLLDLEFSEYLTKRRGPQLWFRERGFYGDLTLSCCENPHPSPRDAQVHLAESATRNEASAATMALILAAIDRDVLLGIPHDPALRDMLPWPSDRLPFAIQSNERAWGMTAQGDGFAHAIVAITREDRATMVLALLSDRPDPELGLLSDVAERLLALWRAGTLDGPPTTWNDE